MTTRRASGAILAFRCIASACEDHCCGRWSVSVDRAAYDKLASRLSTVAPAEREQIFTHLRVREDAPTPERYAQLVLGDDGNCALLEPSGHCSIHARFGEEFLANTCSTYPRFVSQLGDDIEMHGMTSCPEVARLALLGDGTAGIDLHDAERRDDLFVRPLIDRKLEPTDDYRASFLLVRSTLQELLRLPTYPIFSRLFFVGFFADRSRSYLYEGADIDPAALNALIGTMRSSSVLAQLHTQFSRAIMNEPFAISVVQPVLTRPSELYPRGMLTLLDEVRRRFAPATLDGPVEALHAAFEAQRPRLDASTEARLALYVERFALDQVTRGWHVTRPSFVQYVLGLLARVATLRFFLLSHPLLHTQSPSPTDLDALFIRIVYSLARTIDHNVELTNELLGGLATRGTTHLPHMMALLKL